MSFCNIAVSRVSHGSELQESLKSTDLNCWPNIYEEHKEKKCLPKVNVFPCSTKTTCSATKSMNKCYTSGHNAYVLPEDFRVGVYGRKQEMGPGRQAEWVSRWH